MQRLVGSCFLTVIIFLMASRAVISSAFCMRFACVTMSRFGQLVARLEAWVSVANPS